MNIKNLIEAYNWSALINQIQIVGRGILVSITLIGIIAYFYNYGNQRTAISIGNKSTIQSFGLIPSSDSTGFEKALNETNTENIKDGSLSKKMWWEEIFEKNKNLNRTGNLANEATAVGAALTEKEKKIAAGLSNLSVVFSQNYFQKHKIPQSVIDAKMNTCLNYIKKYRETALEEAEIFNIPASITLAQGLLESNAGQSRLALKENNHFGIKCKAKCLGCRCANYTDDDRFDMFRIFESAWESYREHSKLLSGGRYKQLCKNKRSDYKKWAYGLKKAGYATDKNYAEKLIKIIEFFKLNQLDK